MWPIIQVHPTLKMILNYRDWPDQVQFLMNTREDKDVTDCIGAFYVKNDTELSWLIGSDANSDENKIEQLCDGLFISSWRWKRNWVIVTDRTRFGLRQKQIRTTMWSIL